MVDYQYHRPLWSLAECINSLVVVHQASSAWCSSIAIRFVTIEFPTSCTRLRSGQEHLPVFVPTLTLSPSRTNMHGARYIDGKTLSRASGESRTGAGIDKLVAVQAMGAMSPASSGRGKKHTVVLISPCSAPVQSPLHTASALRWQRFLLFSLSWAHAIRSCSLLHPFATTFHYLNHCGWGQVELPQVAAVRGESPWGWSGEVHLGFSELLIERCNGIEGSLVGTVGRDWYPNVNMGVIVVIRRIHE